MTHSVDAPTPQSLADLVARCDQINRFEMQLTAAEESRVAALASGILVMRNVLELEPVDAAKLPVHQGRIPHWKLTGGHLREAETPAIHSLRGVLALDEHEQVKVLTNRKWGGGWGSVALWRSGVHGLTAAAMLEYLARLVAMAQRRAPDAARKLLARSEALAATRDLMDEGPRPRSG
jgi:hypothetical protein